MQRCIYLFVLNIYFKFTCGNLFLCACVWNFPCFTLQQRFGDVGRKCDKLSWPCTAAMWQDSELHRAHGVSIHRNRNSFFELVNKGEYNWNVKEHRDMCRSVTCMSMVHTHTHTHTHTHLFCYLSEDSP